MHGQKFGVTQYIQKNVFEKQIIITIIIIIIIIIIYKDLFCTEQHTPSIMIMTTNCLIFYAPVIAVYSEDHAKRGKTWLEIMYCV